MELFMRAELREFGWSRFLFFSGLDCRLISCSNFAPVSEWKPLWLFMPLQLLSACFVGHVSTLFPAVWVTGNTSLTHLFFYMFCAVCWRVWDWGKESHKIERDSYRQIHFQLTYSLTGSISLKKRFKMKWNKVFKRTWLESTELMFNLQISLARV